MKITPLRKLRIIAEKSIRETAEALNTTDRNMYVIETDKRRAMNMTYFEVEKLSELYKVTMEEIKQAILSL